VLRLLAVAFAFAADLVGVTSSMSDSHSAALVAMLALRVEAGRAAPDWLPAYSLNGFIKGSEEELVSALVGLQKPLACTATLGGGVLAVRCRSLDPAGGQAGLLAELVDTWTTRLLSEGSSSRDEDPFVLIMGSVGDTVTVRASDYLEFIRDYQIAVGMATTRSDDFCDVQAREPSRQVKIFRPPIVQVRGF
jgi:hypothetical protein